MAASHTSKPRGLVSVRPVTKETFDDFVRLFEAKGSPHYCWCTPHRFLDARELDGKQKKARMRKLVEAGTPVGVLAYSGSEPVGWCSVAPRETYLRLGRSRTMPRVTPPDTPTWTVLCFFVVRAHRKQGVVQKLLRGAVAYAKQQGARVVEGYPFDTAGVSSTHRGHSSAFSATGFRQDQKRWARSAR